MYCNVFRYDETPVVMSRQLKTPTCAIFFQLPSRVQAVSNYIQLLTQCCLISDYCYRFPFQVIAWLNSNFYFQPSLVSPFDGVIDVSFKSLRHTNDEDVNSLVQIQTRNLNEVRSPT